MASQESQTTPADACCAPESTGTKNRNGWLMAIPVIGVLLCCGGPVIGAWLASAGLLAVLGSWWAGASHWVLVAVLVVGGLLVWVARRLAARG